MAVSMKTGTRLHLSFAFSVVCEKYTLDDSLNTPVSDDTDVVFPDAVVSVVLVVVDSI